MSILLCYDGSPSARHALTVARDTLSANEIVLLHVWRPPLAAVADSFSEPGDDGGPSTAALEAQELARAHATLEEGRELATGYGLASVAIRVERKRAGGVSATILDVAGQLDSELLVVGTHGSTAVQPGLLGSVSGELVRNAKIPVLIVPTPESAHERPAGVTVFDRRNGTEH